MAVSFLECHELGPAGSHELIGRAVGERKAVERTQRYAKDELAGATDI
jgi:hypothetical protein